MIVKFLAGSFVFAAGVFIAAAITLVVLRLRKAGLDVRGVFGSGRFVTFVTAATAWTLAGLLYLVRAAGGNLHTTATTYGPAIIGGWSLTIAFWFLAQRLAAPRQ